jgi:hypothetical protein
MRPFFAGRSIPGSGLCFCLYHSSLIHGKATISPETASCHLHLGFPTGFLPAKHPFHCSRAGAGGGCISDDLPCVLRRLPTVVSVHKYVLRTTDVAWGFFLTKNQNSLSLAPLKNQTILFPFAWFDIVWSPFACDTTLIGVADGMSYITGHVMLL